MIIDAFDFWKRVDDYMVKNKVSLRDFTAKTGASYSTINSQRTRHSLPKLEQILDMAKFLNTSVEFLATGESILQPLTPEAQAVENDPDLRALVRAVQRDRTLLQAISAVVKSYEKETKIG